MLEKGKSYFGSISDIFDDEISTNRFNKYAPMKPHEYVPSIIDCYMKIGGIQIYDNTTHEVVYSFNDDDLEVNRALRGGFYRSGSHSYHFYTSDGDKIDLDVTHSYDIQFVFTYDGDIEIDDILDEFSLNITSIPSNLYNINIIHGGVGEKIIVELETINSGKIFKFTQSQFDAISLFEFNNDGTPIAIKGEFIEYEISQNKRRLTFSIYGNVEAFRESETITLLSLNPLVTNIINTFEITLYKNASEPKQVTKSITLVSTLQGTLRESCSLISPIITIEMNDVPNFNYVYIARFKRYYYVTDITNIRNNLWNISLKVDVLMSFASIIKTMVAYIERNEYDFNEFIYDELIPFQKDKSISLQNANMHITFNDGENNLPYMSLVLSVIGRLGTSITPESGT